MDLVKVCKKVFKITAYIIIFTVLPLSFMSCQQGKSEVENLFSQAYEAEIGNRPAEALGLYLKIKKEYPDTDSISVDDKIHYFKEYTDTLNGELTPTESISVYEKFLENNREINYIYSSIVIRSLVETKLQLLGQLEENVKPYNPDDYFELAVETYQSIIDIIDIETSNYEISGEPENNLEKAFIESMDAIREARIESEEALPDMFLEWIDSLAGRKNYERAIEFIGILNNLRPADPDFKIEDKYSEIYKAWADDLREDEEFERAIATYEIIINDYPQASNLDQVRTALAQTEDEYNAFKKEIKAVAVIDFDVEVKRDSGGKWSWKTVFTETGGKIGYSLKGEGHIVDANGDKWATEGKDIISRGEVDVSASGKDSNSYWVRGDEFAGGYAIFTWSGIDENGNYIELEEKVYLLP